MSRILDRSFRYTPARKQTIEHLKALFAKERERLKAEAAKPRATVAAIKRATP